MTDLAITKNVSNRRPTTAPPEKRSCSVARYAIAFFKDSDSMLMLVRGFGLLTQGLTLAGHDWAHYAPYFSIATAPLYLFHAVKATRKKVGTMWTAIDVGLISDAFLQGAGAISSLGGAFSDALRPFSGCVKIIGIGRSGFLGTLFGKIIPVTLLTTSALGALASTSGLVGRVRALAYFRALNKRDSKEALVFIQEMLNIDKKNMAALIKSEQFIANHFRSNEQAEELRKEAEESDDATKKIIAQKIQCEIERGLFFHALNLMISAMALTSAALIINNAKKHTALATTLIISAEALGISTILFIKLTEKKKRISYVDRIKQEA